MAAKTLAMPPPLVVAVYCGATRPDGSATISIVAGGRYVEYAFTDEKAPGTTDREQCERTFANIASLPLKAPPHCIGIAGADPLASALVAAGNATNIYVTTRHAISKALDFFDIKHETLKFTPPSTVDAGFFTRCAEGRDPRAPIVMHRLLRNRERTVIMDTTTHAESYVLFSYMIRHLQ